MKFKKSFLFWFVLALVSSKVAFAQEQENPLEPFAAKIMEAVKAKKLTPYFLGNKTSKTPDVISLNEVIKRQKSEMEIPGLTIKDGSNDLFSAKCMNLTLESIGGKAYVAVYIMGGFMPDGNDLFVVNVKKKELDKVFGKTFYQDMTKKM